ncbi:pyridoxamine 5'-phosphate oxidase [Edaphobacter aggregans]|uniref:Pyridoxamine 5'-phosphate oxidase n=1 Tax=Edaphobacter aggregans TaxID=570835 RepID=A0A3R9NSG1_9BACT|nr:pyridoxamine 5'-phosphate oxidase [Edaphobacter aggregans]RSL15692.1 pyridoxamine 5'-phosphate oxidase [Edaphobacter aggregans]
MDERQVETAVDPVALFQVWMEDAETSEPNDPTAVALATASADGAPSVRMVLVKGVDERGFSFYTNAESRKGGELGENPRAAMCFHWKSLRRQTRVEGVVTELPDAEVDAYFHSRSRGSQVVSAVSRQSQPLESREMLVEMARELARETPGDIPRPEWWKGYVLRPERMEFWIEGEYRLHDRFLFVRGEVGWLKTRLFP